VKPNNTALHGAAQRLERIIESLYRRAIESRSRVLLRRMARLHGCRSEERVAERETARGLR
jgi:hypothetical protein